MIRKIENLSYKYDFCILFSNTSKIKRYQQSNFPLKEKAPAFSKESKRLSRKKKLKNIFRDVKHLGNNNGFNIFFFKFIKKQQLYTFI